MKSLRKNLLLAAVVCMCLVVGMLFNCHASSFKYHATKYQNHNSQSLGEVRRGRKYWECFDVACIRMSKKHIKRDLKKYKSKKCHVSKRRFKSFIKAVRWSKD